jgi:hypothetical protein
MSYFQGNFQGAGVPMTDARQTRNFIDRMREQEKQRKERSKALAEDQKRMSMIAQGFGLEKGEVDSMSRGELQGFIENKSMQMAQEKQRQDEILNLQKFASESKARDMNAKSQQMFAQAQKDANQANLQRRINENFLLRQGAESQQKTADSIRREIMQGGAGTKGLNPSMGNNFLIDQYGSNLDKSQTSTTNGLSPREVKELEVDTALSKEVGKDFAEWNALGGPSNSEGKIRTLNEVRNKLESGDIDTGGLVNYMGDMFKAVFDDEQLSAQQAVEQIIQQNMKLTLGGQFTEREARDFLRRSYDSRLKPEQNIKKLQDAVRETLRKERYLGRYYNHFKNDPLKMREFDSSSSIINTGGVGKNYDITTGSGNNANVFFPSDINVTQVK